MCAWLKNGGTVQGRPEGRRGTWVLLRGLTRESAHWGDFPKRLAASLGGSDVLCIDLPGAGLRHGEPSPMSIPEIAADLTRTISTRLGGESVHILALSLGGMVALDAACLAPELVRSVVMVNSSAGRLSRLAQRLRPRAWPLVLGAALEPSIYEREKLIYQLTSNKPMDRHLVGQWEAIQKARPVSKSAFLRQMTAAARYQPERPSSAVPVLVVCSEKDRLVDPVCSRQLAEFLGAPLKVHPTAGHDLPLDDPDFLAQVVVQWAQRGLA